MGTADGGGVGGFWGDGGTGEYCKEICRWDTDAEGIYVPFLVGLILGVVCGEKDFEGGGEAEDVEEMRGELLGVAN